MVYKRNRNKVHLGKIEQKYVFLKNALKGISNLLESPRSDKEMFDGRGWDSFKKEMEANFELMEFKEEEKVRWLVARLTPRFKREWARISRKDSQRKKNFTITIAALTVESKKINL